MRALLFDLGGTHLRCGLTNSSGLLCHTQKVRIANFLHGHDREEISRRLITQIRAYEKTVQHTTSPADPIVFSFPGPILERRRILDAPTVFGDAGQLPNFTSDLQQETGREVYVLNDLSAAAWRLGELEPASRFLVITVSSGIGSKIFDHGHPERVLDNPPYSGEIGHAVVDLGPDAPRCDCGRRGHLGAIASGRGIERMARRRAGVDPAPFLRSACVTRYGANAETLNNETHLVPAAKAGDAWALSVIRDCTRYLAQALLTVVLAAGLERIVVIGGFALELGPVYLALLRELLEEGCSYALLVPHVADLVRLADGEGEICLEGAAAYARYLGQLGGPSS